MRGEEDLKSAQRRPKRQRPRMSEDEDINFDASASRYECPGWTRGNRDRILNVKYKRYDITLEARWHWQSIGLAALCGTVLPTFCGLNGSIIILLPYGSVAVLNSMADVFFAAA